MKKILLMTLILICSYGAIKAQNTDPLPPPYPQIQSFYGMIYEKTLQAIRVKIAGGTVIATIDSNQTRKLINSNVLNFPDSTKYRKLLQTNVLNFPTGMSTSANQKLLYTGDSLIQINTKRVADSLKVWRLRLDTTYQRYKVGAVVQNFPTNPTTSIRQDSLLALLKYLGRSLTLPYFVRGTGQFPPVRDSLVGQTAKVIDVRYSDGTYPTKTNLTLTNLTGTTDTVRIKTWCVAKNDSSYFNVGWKDRSSGVSAVGTPDGNEPDNSLIIIPANTSRTFESDGNGKVSVIRIMWKTTAGKTSTKLYISTQKIN